MAKELSPEEKLLRLIKGKRESPFRPEEMIRPVGEEEKDISKKDGKVTPVEAEKEAAEEKKPLYEERRLKQIKGRPSQRIKVGFPKRLQISSFAIYLCIVAGAIFLSSLVISMFTSPMHKERRKLQDFEALIASISKTTEEEALKPEQKETPPKEELPPGAAEPKPGPSFEEYQKLLTEKNIFAPPVEDRRKPPVPEGPTLRELVRNLRLVGIVPGDEPQAIIEDKKNGQTLFLRKGDQIEGIEIKQIQDGRVVLGYGEETITLSL